MNALRLVIRQPVTVTVGVILTIMAGLVALQRIPIQLTPSVDDTIISVTTFWEGASPEEVEREIVERQEEKLQGLANLKEITSESMQSMGRVRLEFTVGTDKDDALREVSDKLREVPDYPDNTDEPVVEDTDPENKDYIAWVILNTTDPDLEIRTLQDFTEDHIEPVLERVEGIAEINVLGGRERETQIRLDPYQLAQFGITPREFITALQQTNRNVSGGELPDGKFNVRLRTVGQYESVTAVEDTVIAQTPGGPVFVRDVAEVVETYKEALNFVRSKGRPVIAINAQKEIGSNVMEVIGGLKLAIDRLNIEGGVLDTEATRLGLDGGLELQLVYDQTVYINDALALVRTNIWIGGAIAILVLLMFLRSLRTVGIIALAIPISVIGAIVVMVALGRSVNVISLAGMAFAIGLVVDNAIVVLENIFRHIEMGKPPRQAAYDGTREVWGAILGATLTTVFVFVPILLIEEEAGQLFRDIALAICAAVTLSLIVSVTVIPTAAARILRPMKPAPPVVEKPRRSLPVRLLLLPWTIARAVGRAIHNIPERIGQLIYWICGSVLARVGIAAVLIAASVFGTLKLMPPADYLPQGNRNLVFGLLIPPPGHNIEQETDVARRIEKTIRPFWEAHDAAPGSPEREAALAALPAVPTFDYRRGMPGDPVVPPPIENYFTVGMEGIMFHGAISEDPARVVDVMPLFQHATRGEVIPGVMAFAFQVPLFRLGGSTGSAIKIDFSGDDLDRVSAAASSVFASLARQHGGHTVQPSPSNFNIYGPELRLIPNQRRLADVGLTPTDLGLAAQVNGDGAIVGEYRSAGETIDLKVIAADAVDRRVIEGLDDVPIATPSGHVMTLGSLATIQRVSSPPQINHVGRQRSVTLQFTPPTGVPLEQAIADVRTLIEDARRSGEISPDVGTDMTGSASKLTSVKAALLGDGTVLGTLNSSLVMALLVVYLLMCVLFQSFMRPLLIMFSVPLAMLGGFMALYAVFIWSAMDRYLPMQMLDVVTMLGFVILIGVVVNNAILIVHQAGNFMEGGADSGDGTTEPLPPRRAIAEAVRTRIRPIFMGTLTSVGGMLPLVLMPGSGSELYRGLGSVVVGGLLVSTIFTIFLVPVLLSLVTDLELALRRRPAPIAPTLGAGGVPASARRQP